MPCGTGKTFISYHIGEQYKVIIFITSLKQFAEQTIEKFKEYNGNRKGILIDSDGIREVDEIKELIEVTRESY